MKYKHTKEALQEVVKNSLSIADVCRSLGIVPVGGNYKTIKSKLALYNIDTSHFTGQGWNVGKRYKPVVKSWALSDVMVKNSMYSSSKLRQRLLAENIKSLKCEMCFLETWLDQPIKLELHHINGINTDHRLENIQLLCPNCHAYTDNYRGKNTEKSAKNTLLKKEYEMYKDSTIGLPNNKKKPNVLLSPKKCEICGKDCSKKSKKYCSHECLNVAKAKSIPDSNTIIEVFNTYKSFLQVGKHFKVSDNTVRKWCIKYGIFEKVKPPKKLLP